MNKTKFKNSEQNQVFMLKNQEIKISVINLKAKMYKVITKMM